MIKVSEIVTRAEAMFDLFNEHFYDNELIRPAITVSPDGGRGAYGWCSIYEIQNDRKEAFREINICAEYIDRPIAEVARTMLHEMAHLYNLVYGLKDVSNNGYYHNKQFKATAEAHGLIISKHDKYGWTITKLSQETAEWLATVPGMEDITVSHKMLMQAKATADDGEEDGEQEAPKRPTIRYNKFRTIEKKSRSVYSKDATPKYTRRTSYGKYCTAKRGRNQGAVRGNGKKECGRDIE